MTDSTQMTHEMAVNLSEQSTYCGRDQPSDDKADQDNDTWQHETSMA